MISRDPRSNAEKAGRASGAEPPPASFEDGVLTVRVWAQPKALRTEWAGLHEGRVKVRLAAPPVDGEANRALLEFVAKQAGRPKGAATLVQGQTDRRKTVAVSGVSPERWAALQHILLEPTP